MALVTSWCMSMNRLQKLGAPALLTFSALLGTSSSRSVWHHRGDTSLRHEQVHDCWLLSSEADSLHPCNEQQDISKVYVTANNSLCLYRVQTLTLNLTFTSYPSHANWLWNRCLYSCYLRWLPWPEASHKQLLNVESPDLLHHGIMQQIFPSCFC